MKYIRTYKLFESSEPDSIIQEIKDILANLSDEGFDIGVDSNLERYKRNNTPKNKHLSEYIEVQISIPGLDYGMLETFKYEDVKPDIYSLIEYLKGRYEFEYGSLSVKVNDDSFATCNFKIIDGDPILRKSTIDYNLSTEINYVYLTFDII